MDHSLLIVCKRTEENNLSFIETSALDASNVETAFQNILGGMYNAARCQGMASDFELPSLLQKSTTSSLPNSWIKLPTLLPPEVERLSRSSARRAMAATRPVQSVVKPQHMRDWSARPN